MMRTTIHHKYAIGTSITAPHTATPRTIIGVKYEDNRTAYIFADGLPSLGTEYVDKHYAAAPKDYIAILADNGGHHYIKNPQRAADLGPLAGIVAVYPDHIELIEP